MVERKWDRCGSVIEPAGGVRWGQSRLSHAHRPHIRWVTTFPLTISLLGNTLKSDLCTPQKTRKRKTDINTVHHAYFFSEHAQICTKHTIYFLQIRLLWNTTPESSAATDGERMSNVFLRLQKHFSFAPRLTSVLFLYPSLWGHSSFCSIFHCQWQDWPLFPYWIFPSQIGLVGQQWGIGQSLNSQSGG